MASIDQRPPSGIVHKVRKAAQLLFCFLRTGYLPSRLERVCPDVPDWYFEQHFKVYKFARQFAARRNVLDVGCGTGYGTAHLAEVAATAIGIDIDPSTINYCRKRYPLVHFEVMDAHDLGGFPDSSFDLIVSTENFEHLTDQAKNLRELRRVLVVGGICFLASPNSEMTIGCRPNPYHHQENSFSELLALLTAEFSEVIICENGWDPPTAEGKRLRSERFGKGQHGVTLVAGMDVFGCKVDTVFADNTHSFWCFCR
jgi:SAM-dependent methyltransferase